MKAFLKKHWLKILLVLLISVGGITEYLAWVNAYSIMNFSTSPQESFSFKESSLTKKISRFVKGYQKPRPRLKDSARSLGLPFSKLKIPGISSPDLGAWHFPVNSSNSIMILFHGYGNSRSSMLGAVKNLHSLGFSTLLVDFRGAGESSGGNVCTVGFKEADDVKVSFEFVKSMWPGHQVYLFGTSMGAAAILKSMERFRIKPEGILLQSPFDSFLETIRNRFQMMKIPSFPLADLIVLNASIQQGVNFFAFNPRDYATYVTVPVLYLHGELDPKVTIEQAKSIFKNLKSTRKKMVIFQGIGHKFLPEKDPDLFRKSVKEFFLDEKA